MTRGICGWCAVRLSWRSRLRLCGLCGDCHRVTCGEAGIHPAWPCWYRVGERENPPGWFNKTIGRGFN